jgi:hypothetical protein
MFTHGILAENASMYESNTLGTAVTIDHLFSL